MRSLFAKYSWNLAFLLCLTSAGLGQESPYSAPASTELIEVRLSDGTSAWVKPDALVVSAQSAQEPEFILDTARAFVGTPYKWGGTDPNGYDCSGFVQEVFRLSGHSVPRLADAQYEEYPKVTRDELLPGDLVFFNTDGQGVSHVGIYSGAGSFLHSSSSRGVISSPLSQDYYKQRFVGACRPIISGQKKEPPSRFEDD